jgi:hypothetical protein
MKLLPIETFISGNVPFYTVVREYPELRMVPIEHYDTVKSGLTNLGYRFRIVIVAHTDPSMILSNMMPVLLLFTSKRN